MEVREEGKKGEMGRGEGGRKGKREGGEGRGRKGTVQFRTVQLPQLDYGGARSQTWVCLI